MSAAENTSEPEFPLSVPINVIQELGLDDPSCKDVEVVAQMFPMDNGDWDLETVGASDGRCGTVVEEGAMTAAFGHYSHWVRDTVESTEWRARKIGTNEYYKNLYRIDPREKPGPEVLPVWTRDERTGQLLWMTYDGEWEPIPTEHLDRFT